ncbi:hypothetical protein M407DRAFT_81807 [Tulasnella calospora MUT 4182]|uniref:Uncharacterized protein n=1 Tax=Tulasnella calospora MUT 4182 TaxID=1051891 RepID=A0A0C3Q7Y3_9AGAM|nr:hypothetical protein M407DRAFT_81807 [Tulasnella calospora MUT 4182]
MVAPPNADHRFNQQPKAKRKGGSSSSGHASPGGRIGTSGSRAGPSSGSSSKSSTGPIRAIKPGAVFAGRPTGGGVRATDIYGTSVYGSGYTYVDRGRWVAGRGLPFGYWPLYISPNYYGSNEYGPWNNASRLGGNMSYAQVLPPTPHASRSRRALTDVRQVITDNATAPYFVVGDYDSVVSILTFLQSNCSGVVGNATDLNVDLNPLPVEQYLQYYRASSFALALTSYSNPAASVANQPSSNDSTVAQIPPAAIPPGTNLEFLACLNTTIGNKLLISFGSRVSTLGSSVEAMLVLFWTIFVLYSSILS